MSHLTYPDGLPTVHCHLDPAKPHRLSGEGLRVILDPTQCVPADPGAGCPVIVEAHYCDHDGRDVRVSATWACLLNEWEIEGFSLLPRQAAWIDRIADDVGEWLDGAWKLAQAKGGAL